jgi:hypothetical protein
MNTKKVLTDIRFWIFLFFVIRLVGITNPPLEVGHNWRQVTVNMVSRNYLEVDNTIFYPRIDIAGEKSGITGMEFPILNYVIYVVAEVFGYQHWYGRLINLLISSIGLLFFYKLTRKYFDEKIAFYSTIVLAVSIWFPFSRKIMPDTFSMSLIMMSIYFGSNYLDSTFRKCHLINLLSYFLFLLLGVLSKLPSGYLLIVFGIFYLNKNICLKRKMIFAAVSFIAFIPIVFWYFYWVPYLVEKYGFWHFFMGKSFGQGFNEITQNLNITFSRFYDTALKFIGFAVFIYGLYVSIIKKDWKIYALFVLTFVSFAVIILKSGYTFLHHNYYIIPFVPIMALVTGYGLSKMKYSKIAFIILIVISVEGIANHQHDFRIKEKDKRILNLEKDLDSVSFQNDLILINSGYLPTPMYFAHRKGWINTNENIQDEKYIENLKYKGLKYIVILKRSFGTEIVLEKYNKVLENEDYCIYKI